MFMCQMVLRQKMVHKNVKDLEEIPNEIKNQLEIIPVKYISQVLDVAFEYPPTKFISIVNDKVISQSDSGAANIIPQC